MVAGRHLVDRALGVLIVTRPDQRAVVIHDVYGTLVPVALDVFLVCHLPTVRGLLSGCLGLLVVISEAVLRGLSKFHTVVSRSPVQLDQLHLTPFRLVTGHYHGIHFLSLVLVRIEERPTLP